MYAAYLYLLSAALRDDPVLRERDARENPERFEPEPPVPAERREPRGQATQEAPRFYQTVPSNC